MAHSLPLSGIPDLPPSSHFMDYHAELNSILDTLQASLSSAQAASATNPASATPHLAESEQLVSEATDLLTSIELEVQATDPDTRVRLQPYVAAHRDRLTSLRNDVRGTRRLANSRMDDVHRDRLFDLDDEHPDDVRIRLSGHVSDLESASKSISDSRRTITETETTGAAILQDLQNQRATLMRAHGNLGNVDTGLDHSNSIISTMYRRAFVNKIIVYLVFAAIAITICAVIYNRLFSSSNSRTTANTTTSSGGPGQPTNTTTTTTPN